MVADNLLKNSRIVGVDYLKVLCLFLMVLGHSYYLPEDIKSIIYSFHMPVFFFISGILYRKFDIKKNIKSLIVPYFIINALCMFLWTITSLFNSNLTFVGIISRIGAVLLGLGYERYNLVPVCAPTWFFWALFWCRLLLYIYTLFCKDCIRKIISIILIIFSVYIMRKTDIIIPYAFSSSMMAFPIMVVAYEFKNFLDSRTYKKSIFILLFSLTIAIFSYAINCSNGRCDIDSVNYGESLILYYLDAIASSIFLYTLFDKIKHFRRIIYKISVGAVIIVGFHMTIAYYVKKLFWGVESPDILIAVISSIIVLVLCYPIIIFCERYFPIILGETKR